MIRLVGAELQRLRSRRLTIVTALVLLAVMGLFQLAVHASAAPPSGAQLAQAQESYRQSLQDWETNHEQYIAECVQQGESQADCESYNARPTPSDYGVEPTPFTQTSELVTYAASYLAGLASFLLAASFIGAEYSTGSLANWLTFVPERLKVWGSKAIAVALGSALIGAVVAFTLAGLAAAQTAAYGQPLTGAGHLAAASGRIVVLSAVAGLVGFTLALVTRHTVAAIGVPLAYGVVSAVVGGLAMNADGALGWLPPYLPQNTLRAFVDHGATYLQYVNEVTAEGITQRELEKHISFAHSAVYWLVVAVVAAVAGALVFRRRDVT